jgi:hypothetical protein
LIALSVNASQLKTTQQQWQVTSSKTLSTDNKKLCILSMCFNADIPTYLIQQQHGKNERCHNIKENPFPLGRKREAFYFFSIMSVDGFDLL